MDAYSGVKVVALLAQGVACPGVFDVACSEEELLDPKHISASDALIKVGRMTLLAIVDTFEAVISHVGCYIKNGVRLPVR